ncbi:hypothetical protein LTR15_010575 [Elasticomyces elasticus]|nr:hypothetical protein LTR15_010575 [Elasticomyces elasticus]
MLIQAIGLALLGGYILRAAYRLSPWHPLSHIGGPWWTAISSVWLQYHSWYGSQGSATRRLHEKYGSIIRVAPNEVEIADGAALWPVYIKNGGFDKSHHYSVLNIDGHATIFSTIENRDRVDRLKIALPFFSSASVERQVPILEACARQLVGRLKRDKIRQAPVDLQDHCRCYSLDTTTTYVFGKAFGALDEDRLSIARIVDSFVEVNQIFNTPGYLYGLFSFFYTSFIIGAEAKQSDVSVDKWIRGAIEGKSGGSVDDQTTYPGKLLATGMPLSNVVAEGKDSVFGATDALGLTLSLIIWRLVEDPAVYTALREELQTNAEVIGGKLQSLPVLAGIIKETMRISSTVPCKLPRTTPPEGMVFEDTFIPGGSVIGVASCILHLNEKVFPEPGAFIPQRWRDPTTSMNRDWMPFGKGSRACMGRHLALMQLYVAVSVIVRDGVLEGAVNVKPAIEFWEWYNVQVVGGKIEIEWPKTRA